MTDQSFENSSPTDFLADLIILDFTRVLAGPHATRLMADLGARVIKIERPGEGDEMRRSAISLPGEGDHSTYFVRRNAGKESVAVDLSKAEGRAVIHDLVLHADVAIENFSPGVADKLGCGYETLRSIKPDLVYCSISGFGQSGPEAKQGAFAHVMSAASGIMYLDAGTDAPRTSHLQAADVLAGSHAFGAVLAALIRRSRTGQGALVDVSMLESLIASEDLAYASVPNGKPSMPGVRPFFGLTQIGDRWIAWQSAGAPGLWTRLCAAMGTPELEHDPVFGAPGAHRTYWPEIQQFVSDWLCSFDDAESALAALKDIRVPSALVSTPEEVVNNPQILHREAFQSVPHAGGGEVSVTSSPYWLDGKSVPPAGPAPYQIGEHTRRVLTGLLDYDEQKIEALITCEAVACGDSE